jgi:hypothetical protein
MEGRCTGSKRGKGRKRNDTVDYINGGEGREERVQAEKKIHRQAALQVCPPRGGILGRNPDKIHSHLHSFVLRFYFFKLTQPLTVSRVHLLYAVKEKEGKSDRKLHTPPSLWFKKSIPKPQV